MSLNGIDISGWQAGINLAAVPADFVLIKATGGTGFVSPACDNQYQQAKKLGKGRGVYHFAHESGYQGTAVQEARHFLAQIRGYLGDAVLVLDWEGDNVSDVVWAKTWLDTVYAETGVRPVIYMNQFAENTYDWSAVVAANYGLWIAQYPSNAAQGYGALAGPPRLVHWKSAAMWQYTATGRLPGWSDALDLNVFNGDRAAWDAYTRKQGAPAPAAPVKPAPAKPVPVPVRPAPAGTHTVAGGETLTAIAAKYGTTVKAIVDANGIKNADYIQAGQVLRIPKPGTAAPAPAKPAGPTTYRVAPGDNLTVIAAKFGTTVAALVRLNGLPNPDYIQAGQVLRVR